MISTDIVLVFICSILVSILVILINKLSARKKENRVLDRALTDVTRALMEEKADLFNELVVLRNQYDTYVKDSINKYDTLLSQKKSSEVRLGQISEHMAPFMKDWPYDSKNFRFIGSPIDGISFESDHIVFMEIKSGSSKKTKKQKDIRDMVNNSKVKFVTFRVDEEGSRVEEEYKPKEKEVL